MQLSIDGATEKVNDFIRGKGSLQATLKAASNLKEKSVDFSTSMTLTSVDYERALDFIVLGEKNWSKNRYDNSSSKVR